MTRRLLARLVERLARLGDPTVMRFVNVTDDAAWDDHGYHQRRAVRHGTTDAPSRSAGGLDVGSPTPTPPQENA